MNYPAHARTKRERQLHDFLVSNPRNTVPAMALSTGMPRGTVAHIAHVWKTRGLLRPTGRRVPGPRGGRARTVLLYDPKGHPPPRQALPPEPGEAPKPSPKARKRFVVVDLDTGMAIECASAKDVVLAVLP